MDLLAGGGRAQDPSSSLEVFHKACQRRAEDTPDAGFRAFQLLDGGIVVLLEVAVDDVLEFGVLDVHWSTGKGDDGCD